MTETPQTPPPKPPAPAAPAGRSVDEIKADPLVASSVARVNGAIVNAKEFAGEITLTVDKEQIADVARAFKADGWNYLVDLAGVDYSKYPNHSGARFGVAYTLYSFQRNKRVRLRVLTDDSVPSVTSV